jgi:hypothetical protein
VSKCQACHHFRADPRSLAIAAAKFQLLLFGRRGQRRTISSSRDSGDDNDNQRLIELAELDAKLDAAMHEARQNAGSDNKRPRPLMTFYETF